MLSTEEKKKLRKAAELGALATEQQNLRRQQISLQQHVELSLEKERRQVHDLKLQVTHVWKRLQTQKDLTGQVRDATIQAFKMILVLKADMTKEKTMRLRWQKLAMTNQTSLKHLQIAHRRMQHNMTRTLKRLQTKVEKNVKLSKNVSINKCPNNTMIHWGQRK